MSKFIPGNQKHLTLWRIVFLSRMSSLNQQRSFKDIAKYLCKDPTTISKEVKLRRACPTGITRAPSIMQRTFVYDRYQLSQSTNVCSKILVCGIKCTSCPTCNQTCPDFQKEHCSRLDKAPYVCNGCDKKISHCTIVISIPTMRTLLIVSTTRFSRTPEAA
ncbi:MAG: helix-turn-helix domain-containing protein [Waltera sp.]